MCVYSFEEIVDRVRPVAEKYGLRSVYLFGSYARGDANEDSDVDLLIDDGDEVHGLFWLGGVYDDLCIALEKEVDMVTQRALENQRETPFGGRFVQEVELDKKMIVCKERGCRRHSHTCRILRKRLADQNKK